MSESVPDSSVDSPLPPSPPSSAVAAAVSVGSATPSAGPAGEDQAFSNEPLDVTDLPSVDLEIFESLDPNYLRVRLIGDVIFAVIVVIASVVVATVVSWWWLPLAIGAGLLALTGLAAWLQTIEVGHIGYLVREHDFSFRRGVISQDVTTVPFARVQHVSIDRGPLARRFGMATLQMRTAGDGLTVPGISHDVAQRLKALVVDRAGALAEDEFAQEESNTASPATVEVATTPERGPGRDTAGDG